jgi:hypothetical protein
VTLVDAAGRATHRSGMRTLAVRVDDDGARQVGVAGSTADAHWVEVDPDRPDHGEGRHGRSVPAARITVLSLVRGAWELRLSRVDALAAGVVADQVRLRVGGWPIAGDPHVDLAGAEVTVSDSRLRSRLVALSAQARAGVAEHSDASPLGRDARTPWLDHPAQVGVWAPVLVELDATDGRQYVPATVSIDTDAAGILTVHARWPDGLQTTTRITEDQATIPVAEQQDTGPDAVPVLRMENR